MYATLYHEVYHALVECCSTELAKKVITCEHQFLLRKLCSKRRICKFCRSRIDKRCAGLQCSFGIFCRRFVHSGGYEIQNNVCTRVFKRFCEIYWSRCDRLQVSIALVSIEH